MVKIDRKAFDAAFYASQDHGAATFMLAYDPVGKMWNVRIDMSQGWIVNVYDPSLNSVLKMAHDNCHTGQAPS